MDNERNYIELLKYCLNDNVPAPECIKEINWHDLLEFAIKQTIQGVFGRTILMQDGKMHKERITSKVHLELEWANVGDTDAQTILTAFQPEYISIKYFDYKENDFLTKTFYVGDRSEAHTTGRGRSAQSVSTSSNSKGGIYK